jgi:hypothetical protein
MVTTQRQGFRMARTVLVRGGGSMAGIDVGIIFVTGGVRSNDNDPVEGAGPVLNGDHRARS